ncbi:MAG: hypothetical protein H7318_12725 [Oligoflexus sp.]|nr:hypothetical protein [Oligoflexus sp.]
MGCKKTIPELTDKELISAWKEADEDQDPRFFAEVAVEVQKRFGDYQSVFRLALIFPIFGIGLFMEEDFSTGTIITFATLSIAIPLVVWSYGRWQISRVLLKTGHTWFQLPYIDSEKLAELRKRQSKTRTRVPVIDVDSLEKPQIGENIDPRGPRAAVIAIPLTLSLWLACYIFIINGTLLEKLGVEIHTHTKFKVAMVIIFAFHCPLQLWLRFRTPELDRKD